MCHVWVKNQFGGFLKIHPNNLEQIDLMGQIIYRLDLISTWTDKEKKFINNKFDPLTKTVIAKSY